MLHSIGSHLSWDTLIIEWEHVTVDPTLYYTIHCIKHCKCTSLFVPDSGLTTQVFPSRGSSFMITHGDRLRRSPIEPEQREDCKEGAVHIFCSSLKLSQILITKHKHFMQNLQESRTSIPFPNTPVSHVVPACIKQQWTLLS